MLNRQHKAQAPEAIVPKGKFTRARILSRYAEERARTLEFVRKTEARLNEQTAEHSFPIFNTLSAYQWVLYIPLHNLRHNQQIAEVKATSGYPRAEAAVR